MKTMMLVVSAALLIMGCAIVPYDAYAPYYPPASYAPTYDTYYSYGYYGPPYSGYYATPYYGYYGYGHSRHRYWSRHEGRGYRYRGDYGYRR